jgi:hypothetical protein
MRRGAGGGEAEHVVGEQRDVRHDEVSVVCGVRGEWNNIVALLTC